MRIININTNKLHSILFILLPIVLIVAFLIFSSVTIVSTGEVGIRSRLGKAVSKEAEEYMRLYRFFSFVPEGIGYAGVGSVWYRPPSSKLRATNYTYKKDDGYFFSLSAAHKVLYMQTEV